MDGRRVKAVFIPVDVDTLRPENKPFIGGQFTFYQAWEIAEEDGGLYVGQDAWLEESPTTTIIGWVPTEDLVVIETISERWEN